MGCWATTTSGALYTLLGDFAMQYFSHNVALDPSTGNFLGRDETELCSLWVHTENNVEKTYIAPIASIGTVPVWTLQRTFDVATGNLTISGTATASTFIGNSITQQPYDVSTKIATTEWVAFQTNLIKSTEILSNITGGTHSFATLGSGAAVSFTAVAGVLTSIDSITAPGTLYAVGDMLIVASGNYNAIIRVASLTGSGIATVTLHNGGTGYVTSSGTNLVRPGTLMWTWVINGTLTSNALFIVPNGTNLTASNQWLVANNTTGAFSTTIKISNGSNSPTGTGVVIPQGTNYSASASIQTDGVTDVWFAAPTLTGSGASGTWNIGISGNAATVTTNANLTGVITAVGNTTSIASQTGTGTKLVVDTSPTLVTPNIGAATGISFSPAAGTTTVAPIVLTAGTNLTTATAGAIEFDGTAYYSTVDTTNGRTQLANTSIFRLAADGGAIGPTIADYFGTNSSFPTVLNGVYEITFYLYFLKTAPNGTVTFTVTNTQAYTNIVADYAMFPIGAVATGQYAGIDNTTTAVAALPVSGSLTGGLEYRATVHCIAECATAGNIRLRVTQSGAGTITPRRGSYYTVRRLAANQVGTFVA
jgi:hypothetical protein